MLKSMVDKAAKSKAKRAMLAAIKDKGLDIEPMMTNNINSKLDDLLQAIIDDIGYKKLALMGIK